MILFLWTGQMNGTEIIFLDTHVVVWLFQKERDKFTQNALNLLDNRSLFISPIVKLELEYLFEIDRLRVDSRTIVEYLYEKIGLGISNNSFDVIINKAKEMKWTRDPFDRIIVATAALNNSVLISKDDAIRKNYSYTEWE
jgi:PIN domain nuclease of toxin-antitoxin system